MRRSMLALVTWSLTSSSPAHADIEPPGYATIQRLAKSAYKLRDPKAHGRGVDAGGGRFFAVVHHRDEKKTRFLLDLLQLEQRAGAWAISGRWPLAMKSAIRGGNPHSPAELCAISASEWKPASALFFKDYDKDGKPELLLRFKFCWMIPAIGPTSVRTLQLYNLSPKGIDPRPALSVEIEHDARPTTMGRTLARYRFEDLDRDGHPDLRLSYESTAPDKVGEAWLECTESWQRRYLWQQARDRYVEQKDKKMRRRKRRCKKSE